jgi:hypothetical protein
MGQHTLTLAQPGTSTVFAVFTPSGAALPLTDAATGHRAGRPSQTLSLPAPLAALFPSATLFPSNTLRPAG